MVQRFLNTSIPLVLLATLLSACGNHDHDLPNIIFYLADDQDVNDYGCYGNPKIITPGVDRLAREGLMFRNAFTGQAICTVSRM